MATSRFGKRLLHSPLLLCFLSFGLCFFIAAVIFLPLAPFAHQLELRMAKQGIPLQIEQPQLLFPPGIGAQKLRITPRQRPQAPFLFENAALSPRWTSLVSSNQGARFEAHFLQGKISGSAYRNGQLSIHAEKLHLDEPLGPQLPLIFVATLEQGEFDGRLPLTGKNSSQLQLQLIDARLAGLKKLGNNSDTLMIGRLRFTAKAQGPLVQITQLSSSGPAFDLKGTGTLRIGRTAASSSLNLTLVLTPKELDPTLLDLLTLVKKPQADGNYRFNLRGSLLSPRIN